MKYFGCGYLESKKSVSKLLQEKLDRIYFMAFDSKNNVLGQTKVIESASNKENISITINQQNINFMSNINKVNGKVVVRETGQGIPNLLVSLHDLDITKLLEGIFPKQNSKKGNSSKIENYDNGGSLKKLEDIGSELFNDPTNNELRAAFLAILLSEEGGLLKLENITKNALDNLGSRITNEKGEFLFQFTDEEFADPNLNNELITEDRPDLLIVVHAPLDQTDITNYVSSLLFPYSTNYSNGTLFFNFLPRFEAAREEAFLIRIPSAILDRNEISYPGSKVLTDNKSLFLTTKIRRDDIITSIDNDIEFCDRINNQLNERYKPKYLARKDLIKKIRETKFQEFSLSNFPKAHRVKDTYLGPNDDLSLQLNNLITNNLDRANGKLSIITLSDEQLTNAGFTKTANGDWEGTGILLDELLALKGIQGSDSIITAGATLPEAFLAKERAKIILNKIINGDDDDSNEEESSPASQFGKDKIPTDQILGDLLERQLLAMNGPEKLVSLSPVKSRNDGASLKENIDSLKLHTGPADNVSFHDFYNLQIAFEDIWTEVFDDSIRAVGEELYEEYVLMEHTYSGLNGEPQLAPENNMLKIEARKDIDNLMKSINDTFKAISAVNPPPETVKRLVPEITSEQWNALSPEDRASIMDLADIQ